MPTHIDLASAEKIAAAHARAGKPLPAAMQGHARLRAAYAAAGGTADSTDDRKSGDDHGRTKAQEDRAPARRQRPVRQAAPVAPKRPPGDRAAAAVGGYAARGFSPRGAAARLAATRPGRAITRTVGAGDTGGLLLGIVVYPVFLAAMKYGPTGPGQWFRAKWLNNETGSTGTKRVQGTIPPGMPNLLNPHPQQRAHRHHPGQARTPRGHH